MSEGIASPDLIAMLEIGLPKKGKKRSVTLGVSDKNLAGSIKSSMPGVECQTSDTSEVVGDMLRSLRLHAPKLLKELHEGDIERGQLGLAHAYSRGRVKFSVQKNDNHIIQAIAILDSMDKAINTFSMRVREWYSWHFPELIKIVSDNYRYARIALFVRNKTRLAADDLHELAAQVDDDGAVAQRIIDSAKVSMGRDISESDMDTVMAFAERVVALTEYRRSLHQYLVSKMSVVAPNLAALIGEVIGARLISHAGSLANLCKYPASTVQILGAEKALFRALKTKGNTPKYGLLFHSSFIGRAGQKNKGRISRFLANKCSIASRIDNFSESPSNLFGEVLRKQVEERLDFYSTGVAPTKNADAMVSGPSTAIALLVDQLTRNLPWTPCSPTSTSTTPPRTWTRRWSMWRRARCRSRRRRRRTRRKRRRSGGYPRSSRKQAEKPPARRRRKRRRKPRTRSKLRMVAAYMEQSVSGFGALVQGVVGRWFLTASNEVRFCSPKCMV